MPIFQQKMAQPNKSTRVNTTPTPKKPMNTAVYQTSHKPNFRCGWCHTTTGKNYKHFYIPQNETVTPPLKRKVPFKWVQRNQKPQQPPLRLPLCSPGSGWTFLLRPWSSPRSTAVLQVGAWPAPIKQYLRLSYLVINCQTWSFGIPRTITCLP